MSTAFDTFKLGMQINLAKGLSDLGIDYKIVQDSFVIYDDSVIVKIEDHQKYAKLVANDSIANSTWEKVIDIVSYGNVHYVGGRTNPFNSDLISMNYTLVDRREKFRQDIINRLVNIYSLSSTLGVDRIHETVMTGAISSNKMRSVENSWSDPTGNFLLHSVNYGKEKNIIIKFKKNNFSSELEIVLSRYTEEKVIDIVDGYINFIEENMIK